MRKILHQGNGQSLVEVVVAMAIMAVVVVAVMIPILASRGLLYNSENVTEATSLAEQGLEIVKNNRDIGCKFNDLGSGTYVIAGDVSRKLPLNSAANIAANETLVSYAGQKINIYSPNNEYQGFTRKIYLDKLSEPQFNNWADPPTSNNFGSLNNSFDSRDKYYYVKVEVSKSGSFMPPVDISTIMLIRGKDN